MVDMLTYPEAFVFGFGFMAGAAAFAVVCLFFSILVIWWWTR